LQQFSDFDFLWHREYRKKVQGFISMLWLTSLLSW
jgi:hypothetical protein